jgi:hypothetical protein
MRFVRQKAPIGKNNILAGLCHSMIAASMTVPIGGLK